MSTPANAISANTIPRGAETLVDETSAGTRKDHVVGLHSRGASSLGLENEVAELRVVGCFTIYH